MAPTSDYTSTMYTTMCHVVHRYKKVKNFLREKNGWPVLCHLSKKLRNKGNAIISLSSIPFKKYMLVKSFE